MRLDKHLSKNFSIAELCGMNEKQTNKKSWFVKLINLMIGE
jgi:hypothetical protein